MKQVIVFIVFYLSVLVGGYAVAGPQCPVGTKIDDGKACTLDECTMLKGRPKVTHALACPVGAACNAKGACEKIDPNAACKGVNIDDGKACTAGTCKVINGKPVVTQKEACPEGATCNAQGNCETPDKCANNPDVDDGKECTVDTCDPYTGATWHASNCTENMECTETGCQPMKCHADYDYIETVPEECVKGLKPYVQKPTYGCAYKYSEAPKNPYDKPCPIGLTYFSANHESYKCAFNDDSGLSFDDLAGQVTCPKDYISSTATSSAAKYVSCYPYTTNQNTHEICGVGGKVDFTWKLNKQTNQPMWCCY